MYISDYQYADFFGIVLDNGFVYYVPFVKPHTMKILLTSLLLSLCISAMGQQSRSACTHTSINDDAKTLSIRVEGTVDGKQLSYNRRFNVQGMSSTQKDALKASVLDSLGVGESPKPPKPPKAPKPSRLYEDGSASVDPSDEEQVVTFVCSSCTGRMRLEVTGDNFSLTRETNTRKEGDAPFPMTVDMRPGEYKYTYWQDGVQQMNLSFTVKAKQKNEVTVK